MITRLKKIKTDKITSKKIRLNTKKDFYYMMDFFLKSNLPISDALDLMAEDRTLGKIEDIREAIANGEKFALALHDAGLTDHFINSCLLIGENSGSYQTVLSDIVRYLEQKIEDRNYFMKIVSYPLILVVLLVFISLFLIFFLTPSLYTTFEGMNIAIPMSLEVFHAIYQFSAHNRFVIFMVMVAISSIIISGIFNQKIKKNLMEFALKNNVINRYLKPFWVRSILWQIHILTSSGMGMNAAIEIVKSNTNFMYRSILQETQNKIEKGFSISSIWEEHRQFFPSAIIKYIKIGESTGYLEENLGNSVAYMEFQCKNILEKVKQTMQPAFVIIAGCGITLLLILVLPIINSATTFGGL